MLSHLDARDSPAPRRCAQHGGGEYFCADCRRRDDPEEWRDYVADQHGGDEEAARAELLETRRWIDAAVQEESAPPVKYAVPRCHRCGERFHRCHCLPRREVGSDA
jgi:hypothetical protein